MIARLIIAGTMLAVAVSVRANAVNYPISPVPFAVVQMKDGFWLPRLCLGQP